MDLDVRKHLNRARQHKDVTAVRLAYQLMTDGRSGALQPRVIAPELRVACAEEALQLGCLEISAACLKLYFEGNPATNQFLCRAYLCQGQLKSPATTGNAEDFESMLLYFQKAIEISKNNPRYHFLVFNASLRYMQAVRPLLRPRLRARLAPSLALVVSALEEVAEPDHAWRAELMMQTSGGMPCGCREKGGRLQIFNRYFRIRQVHNKLLEDSSPEMTMHCPSLAVLHKIQNLKKVEGGERGACHLSEEDVVELQEVFILLVDRHAAAGPYAMMEGDTPTSPSQTPAAIPPAERVVLLLELAVLALQWKQQEVVASCLKELNSAKETTASQHVMLECVQCELNVLRKQEKTNAYSKAGIEARLKEIGKLDRLLRRAVAEGDPGAVQAACATQWSVCLPLLQRNLRKRIQPELQRVAQVLEDMQSMLLETRCQVHSELASMEEEEGRLGASLGHLERAMLLADGPQRERLSTAVNRLHLRGTLYTTPSRPEDRAAMLLQQAKDKPLQDMTDIRHTLVQAGLFLAPDAFQTVLDADSIPESNDEPVPAVRLSAKAQHHSRCVQGVQGHLERWADDSNGTERVRVWAVLVKAARGQEVWDVCRAASRFSLLYDDDRWTEKSESLKEEQGSRQSNASTSSSRDVLRLLAEVCFINAEATVQKLRSEGVELNSPAVPPQDRGGPISEDHQHWVVYRDWIQSLSAYATAGFLRGAELGAELGEWWMVDNAAVYLWNYSRPLLATGEYRTLLPIFQTLVDTLRRTGHCGDHTVLVGLCDAVARGLLQPLLGRDGVRTAQQPEDRTKKGAAKTTDKTGSSTHVGGTLTMEPAALQDLHRALELCEFALHLSSGTVPGKRVSMATRKQVLATWVQIKKLLQQPVGQTTGIAVECKEDESVAAMTRVLVAVEMQNLCCDRSGVQAEPSVPGLSSLVRAASDCAWSDAAVELQVWSQLALLCHRGGDHNLVLQCTQAALLLEGAASRSIRGAQCPLYGPHAVNEMLSSMACLRGLSLTHKSNGDLQSSREALQVLLSSVSYAEKAQSPALCRAAARHYWNSCLPLTQAPADRQQLQGPLERILSALCHTGAQHTKQGEAKGRVAATALAGSEELTNDGDDDVGLRAGMYHMLFCIHGDRGDWERALQVLDKAVRELPRSKHRMARYLFYLDLLVKELHSLSLPHLSLPVLHLAETIAHDLLDRKGLSDLYRLRIVKTCCQLGMEAHSPYRDELLDLSSIREQELIECRKAIFIARQRKSQNMLPKQSSSAEPKPELRVLPQRAELSSVDVWLDKAEVCLSMGLYPSAGQLLAEAHLLAKEVGHQEAEARCVLGLAVLACEEGNPSQALELLNRAQDLGGDEEFWYQLTLTQIRATTSQGDQQAGAKVDVIIQQGCGALRSVLGQRPNRAPRLRFWIASLETRGAAECISTMSQRGPGETLSAGETLRLTYACDTLREATRELTELGHEEQAAQACLEHAMGLRVLARHAGSVDEGKRHLLDSVYMLQEAVSLQEHALLRARSWAPSQESPGLTLVSMRRLQRLRLSLAELCLATLEQLHAEDEVRARQAKTSAQRVLEEFTCHTPEPGSLDQEWASAGPTLAQVALGQLAAVDSLCAAGDGADGALCSALTGKCLRLLAARKDPLYPSNLWDAPNQARKF
ncbi:Cilia- and flagella-associated protein 46 [Merluccius polli]|uniref:Cilia- and flagella-associated protein 46 n=1 Tax=Merluccius polli TaxID=89951 RepID=A0AA47NVW9_MERPO|nr:Cilia- and flagella-associated protein 46 [Merluccius polli]